MAAVLVRVFCESDRSMAVAVLIREGRLAHAGLRDPVAGGPVARAGESHECQRAITEGTDRLMLALRRVSGQVWPLHDCRGTDPDRLGRSMTVAVVIRERRLGHAG